MIEIKLIAAPDQCIETTAIYKGSQVYPHHR